jgi:hypothetical protein
MRRPTVLPRTSCFRMLVGCSTIIAVLGFCTIGIAVPPPVCILLNRNFESGVWAKVGERSCLRCHNKNGDAAESHFVLSNPRSSSDDEGLRQNRLAFERMAKTQDDQGNRLLLKVVGELDHGGGQVLSADSTAYKALQRFVNEVNNPQANPVESLRAEAFDPKKFFDGLEYLPADRLLRRITLSLAGRLPTATEGSEIQKNGLKALNGILNQLMKEEAFYVRLKEGFNDIFLTVGIEDNAETLLSYEHFEHTRLWYSTFDLSHVPEADRQTAQWKLADVYRESLLREPLELIAHIVRNERPFTELVNADYIMVSPYTARGYGIYDELKDKFTNANDPFEYIPAKLKALRSREGHIQESTTGMYPHAGFLSTFHYLRRYPSTETNRNRLRARMFYQHFLGVDIMQLAPRATDASAVAKQYEIPTMQAADCVVCHRTIDPVASAFQDYNFEGHVGPRKAGWYQDMFQAGFEGEQMPASERWRAPQWLAERTIQDARFPIAMVEHVYFILTGRKVLKAPEDIEDPLFDARRRAYTAQRVMIERVADHFKNSGFNLKTAFKDIIASDFYRIDGISSAELQPQRKAELDDIGIVRLISPEQLERKIAAIFGKPWGKLSDEVKILYGGIDSITVTDRNADPSGAMGAIQRILANDLSCHWVSRDFRLASAERRLFPGIESDVVPGSAESDAKIRQTIVQLHQLLLGVTREATHPEVERTFQLFGGILEDAKKQPRIQPYESYFCGGRDEFRSEDPHYTLRAWRGVVAYLLRQHEFLYE